ncbi:hypothetical protein [Schleiferilactobacillus harbinensis]|uniref:hypothetical protein n=1 Tax=Schleiferilactobacillus harbinensis TaxID=304207 RepID=UPI0007BA7BDC|nr:hypothetical protein [Schleiferilactobacillus harbinensis]
MLIVAGTVSATGVYLSKRPQLLRNTRFRRTIHRLKHTAHFSRLAQTDWAIHNEQQYLFKQPLVMATLQALPANLRNQQAVASGGAVRLIVALASANAGPSHCHVPA